MGVGEHPADLTQQNKDRADRAKKRGMLNAKRSKSPVKSKPRGRSVNPKPARDRTSGSNVKPTRNPREVSRKPPAKKGNEVNKNMVATPGKVPASQSKRDAERAELLAKLDALNVLYRSSGRVLIDGDLQVVRRVLSPSDVMNRCPRE